jgi:hypothetical protein
MPDRIGKAFLRDAINADVDVIRQVTQIAVNGEREQGLCAAAPVPAIDQLLQTGMQPELFEVDGAQAMEDLLQRFHDVAGDVGDGIRTGAQGRHAFVDKFAGECRFGIERSQILTFSASWRPVNACLVRSAPIKGFSTAGRHCRQCAARIPCARPILCAASHGL